MKLVVASALFALALSIVTTVKAKAQAGPPASCAALAPLVGARTALEKAKRIPLTSDAGITERALLIRNADREMNRLDVRSADRCDEIGTMMLLGYAQGLRNVIEAETIVPALHRVSAPGACQTLALARRRAAIVSAYQGLAAGRALGVSSPYTSLDESLDADIRVAARNAQLSLPALDDSGAIGQLALIAESQVSSARASLTVSCDTATRGAAATRETKVMLYGS